MTCRYTDGYYLVKFTREPTVLQEDTVLDASNGDVARAGETVVEGHYYTAIPGASRWYYVPSLIVPEEDTKLFRVRYIVEADALVDRLGDRKVDGSKVSLPNGTARWQKQT